MNLSRLPDGAKNSSFGSGFHQLPCLALLTAVALWLSALPVMAQASLGTALSFDGVDDLLMVTNFGSFAPTNEITIEFWQRAAAARKQVTFTLAPDDGGTNAISATVPGEDGAVCWDFGNKTMDGRLWYVPTNSIIGTWQHFALVASQSGNFMRIYRNGVLEAEKIGMTPFVPEALDLQLGGSSAVAGVGSAFFQGELDEVRIWRVARSQTDITNNMLQQLAGTETDLVVYYRFSEAAGIRAYDATTNHLDGTLVNRSRRVPSIWWPVIALNGPNLLTNECHVSFVDPGATVRVAALAVAATTSHNLALKADGTVVGWGTNYHGQITVSSSATNVVAIAAGANHSLALKADGTVVGWGYNYYGQITVPSRATNVVAIAAGQSHSLALKADGTVVGWGFNYHGQITVPSSATNLVAIAAEANHSLALKADGTVVGWGYNNNGQITVPSSATNVVAIATGGAHSLALKADGTIVGWGYNYFGQITVPSSATNVVAIAAGVSHSLALKSDGTAVGWGDNAYSKATIPSSVYSLLLSVMVSGSVNANVPGTYILTCRSTNVLGAVGVAVRMVVVADTLPPVLALVGDNPLLWSAGSAWAEPGARATDQCAGDLTDGISVSGTVDTTVPGNYQLTYTVADACGNTGLAVRTVAVGLPEVTTLPPTDLLNDSATLHGSANPNGVESVVWLEWGTSRAYGQRTGPSPVGSGTTPVASNAVLTGLTPGLTYHYRLVSSNSVGMTCGENQSFWTPALTLKGSHAMSNECHARFVEPGVAVSSTPVAIAAGHFHNLVLRPDGTVVGWGAGTYDTQTYPTLGQVIVPRNATNVVALAAGACHSLALKADGTVLGWGDNLSGQATSPAAATNVIAIAGGYYFSLALKSDHTVIGWGNNGQGQISIPASATNVVAIAGGYDHGLALRGDGSVIAWGDNSYHQLNVPASATNVVAIGAGYRSSLALKADGTVIAWGVNYDGQLNVPASATNVVAIADGDSHNLALKADGTVIAWGYNYDGQLNVPASATNVVAIAAGRTHSLALRSDGALVAWGSTNGYNYYGQNTIPSSATNLNLPVTLTGSVDTNSPGVYALTYSTTNAQGAVGTATRTVAVVDTRPPVLRLLGYNPLMHEAGTPFIDPGATATDLCAGDLTTGIVTNMGVNGSVPGIYTNAWTVSDASGNVTAANRTVVVVTRPVLSGPGRLANGAFQLQFTNTPGARFGVRASTNLALPFSQWSPLGLAIEGPDGEFHFADPAATSAPNRFYRLCWPP